MSQTVLIGLGANISGNFGSLQANFTCSIDRLAQSGHLKSILVSSLYDSTPLGCRGRQPRYLNAVLRAELTGAPARLMRLLKEIERQAGRRRRGLNAARPLDLDILDLGGRRIGWPCKGAIPRLSNAPSAKLPTRRGRGWMTVPHPELHHRRFVLVPLLEVAPHWHHPVFRVAGRRLLVRLQHEPGQLRRLLDSGWHMCDTSAEQFRTPI